MIISSNTHAVTTLVLLKLLGETNKMFQLKPFREYIGLEIPAIQIQRKYCISSKEENDQSRPISFKFNRCGFLCKVFHNENGMLYKAELEPDLQKKQARTFRKPWALYQNSLHELKTPFE